MIINFCYNFRIPLKKKKKRHKHFVLNELSMFLTASLFFVSSFSYLLHKSYLIKQYIFNFEKLIKFLCLGLEIIRTIKSRL